MRNIVRPILFLSLLILALFALAAVAGPAGEEPATTTRPTTDPTAQPTTQESPAVTIRSQHGKVVFDCNVEGRVSMGAGRYFCSDGKQVQFDDYRPKCYFSGRVCLRADENTLELAGWREVYHDWQVIRFSLTQTAGKTTVEYTVRTPVGQPDVTAKLEEPDGDTLLIRHPEIACMLGEVLKGFASNSNMTARYDLDPATLAQLDPGQWHEPEGIADEIDNLLTRYAAAATDARQRERIEKNLQATGTDGALYMLLRLDREKLNAQQNLAIENVLKLYPRLNRQDRLAIQKNPDILKPIIGGDDKLATVNASN